MYRYEVIHGNHCSKDENGQNILIKKGGVFDSPQENLHINHPDKFKLRDSSTKTTTAKESEEFNVDLEIMSEDELRAYAKEAGIELGNTRKRESMIAKIQEAEAGGPFSSEDDGEESEA